MADQQKRFWGRLIDQVEWSRRQLLPHLEKYHWVIRQFVGRHYGSSGCKEKVPQNFVRLMLSVFERHLVPRQPRCIVDAVDRRLRAVAKGFEQWGNDRFEAIDLEATARKAVKIALIYPLGTLYTGVCRDPYEPVDYAGPLHDFGEPFVDVIDPERHVVDMAATSFDQIDFEGHRRTTAKEALLMRRGVDVDSVRDLNPDPQTTVNEMGGEKTSSLTQTEPFNFNRIRDYIDVWEIYLPKEGVLAHFPVTGNQIRREPILVEQYQGLRTGPYNHISFDDVPGNLLPTPPVHAIIDLHEIINKTTLKLGRQSLRQKTLLLVMQAMAEEAKKITKAGDGEAIPVTNPEAFKEVRFGGPDAANMGMVNAETAWLNRVSGNLDALAGTSPQSPTLGQDQLLAASSSKLLENMSLDLIRRLKDVERSVLFYDWNSKKNLVADLQIPGRPGEKLPYRMTPEMRGGGQRPEMTRFQSEAFFRMNFKVDPYSMQPASPQQRGQQVMALVNQIVAPLLPMLSQQGTMIDVVEVVRLVANYWGIKDIDSILMFANPAAAANPNNPPPQMQPPVAAAAPTFGKPNGNYTRTNVSGGKPENQIAQMMASMGSGSNNGQGAR